MGLSSPSVGALKQHKEETPTKQNATTFNKHEELYKARN